VEKIMPKDFAKETKVEAKKDIFTKDPIGLAISLVAAGKTTEEAIKAVKEIQKAFI
jgi:hypothetical protein